MPALSSGLIAAGIPHRLWFYDGRDEDQVAEAQAGTFHIRNGGRDLAMEDLGRARVVVHRTGRRPLEPPDHIEQPGPGGTRVRGARVDEPSARALPRSR